MKNPSAYTITVVAILGGLLGACSQINTGSLKANAEGLGAFKCIQVRTTNTYSFEYNNEGRRLTLVSYAGDGISETIVGDTSNAFEKEGKLIWKHRFGQGDDKVENDYFLDLKTMKLRLIRNTGKAFQLDDLFDCKRTD